MHQLYMAKKYCNWCKKMKDTKDFTMGYAECDSCVRKDKGNKGKNTVLNELEKTRKMFENMNKGGSLSSQGLMATDWM